MKHTIQTLELLEQSIGRLVDEGISVIERDIILERLRKLYTAILDLDCVDDTLDDLIFMDPVIVADVTKDDEDEEAETEESIEDEPIEEVAEENDELEDEVVEESTQEPLTTIVIEDSDSATEQVVLSLYDDDDDEDDAVEETVAEEEAVEVVYEEEEESIVEPEEEEEVVETIEEDAEISEKADGQVVLGDVLGDEQTRLGDTFQGRVVDVASVAASSASIRQSISLNDKYVLMRDLFAGDNEYYNRVIDKLDSFDSLDEAMLYIYDNHHWNSNSDGVRLLMELLSQKLL